MDLAFIQKLIELHERSGMVELEFAQGDQRLRLSKVPVGATGTSSQTAAQNITPDAVLSDGIAVGVSDLPGPHGHVLKTTLSGTFHRRPSPAEPPYVDEGDLVQQGQMVGVVEAMKVLNSIESEWPGRIVAVLVEDGASVEPGTALFRIEAVDGGHV